MKTRDDVLKIILEEWYYNLELSEYDCSYNEERLHVFIDTLRKILSFPVTASIDQFSHVMPEDLSFWWAKTIGDHEIMAKNIRSIPLAFSFAKEIGYREILINLIDDYYYIKQWLKKFGDLELLRKKIISNYEVFCWVSEFNDQPDYFKHKITTSFYAKKWIDEINPNDKQFFIDKGLLEPD